MARVTRRDLVRIGFILGVAGVVMARPWQALRRPELAFEPIADLPPLRRLTAPGEASGGSARDAVFVGLTPPGERASIAPAELDRLRAEICRLLGLSWAPGDPVPVTYFTDVNCPSCRRLEADLVALSGDEGPAFSVVTREYPVFGARSEAAARVIRAAGTLGRAEEMRRHLQTRPSPDTAPGVAALAARMGLDQDALAAAWASEEVAARLREDRGLARLLGLPGTPGLVVGRTLVIGAPPRARLAALLALEEAAGAPAACAGM